MTARPRLIHVTTTDISLALLLGPQLEAFLDAGYEVMGASAPGPFSMRLAAAGIRHLPLRHATRAMAPHRDLAALGELVGLFRELRPDIVHTHNPKPGVYGRLAARAAGVPVIVNTVHGLYATPDDRLAKRAVVYALERVAATCSNAELLQNEEDLPVLRRLRIGEQKLHVLGNGIDLTRFDPAASARDPQQRNTLRKEMGAEPGDVLVGAVGRLVWEKGYRELFEAARALASRAPHIKFAVVGPADDDKSDAITAADRAAAEEHGNITFLGHRDDVEDLYPVFDLYVLASYREGFPRSAMEAAAMGCPIVATDIRGCRQVVDDGVNGLLVAPRNAAALARAIEAIATDTETRHAMGQVAIAKAHRDFDQRHVIDLTLSVYETLLRERGTNRRSRRPAQP